jgi:rare lipoprotein A
LKRFTTLTLLLITAAMLVSVACGRRPRASIPPTPRPGDTETGIASWYGDPYHGRQAANGEKFDMDKLTAAHRTLPFDTNVRVTNLSNHREVDVRIIDRGPFVDGRIIDLSREAARRIGIIGPGTALVRIRVLDVPPNAKLDQGLFTVQAGAFRDRARAERLRHELAGKFPNVRIAPSRSGDDFWRVLVGRETSIDAAHRLLFEVRKSVSDALVVRE